MFEGIDFGKGKVSFCDDGIYLKEDLLQVEYSQNKIIDVGWYTELNGFIIYVIQSNNWELPINKYIIKEQGNMLCVLQSIINDIETI